MKIDVMWSDTIYLADAAFQNRIFKLPEHIQVPSGPGIYLLGRKYAKSLDLVYIGKAENLKYRIDNQLNNLSLMMTLKKSGKGNKYIMYGRIKTKPGQKVKKVIDLLERSFIEYSHLKGFELLNVQCGIGNFHKVTNFGNLDIRRLLSYKMLIKP